MLSLCGALILSGLAQAQTNTNACIQLLGSTRGCFSTAATATTCPTAVTNFNNAKCFCNEVAIKLLDAPYPTAVSIAKSKYGATPNCNGFETRTYNGGTCSQSDTLLDALRFNSVQKFSETILKLGLSNAACLDYDQFRLDVGKGILPDAIGYAGQGLGTYYGADHITEYFSLLSPLVNHGFVTLTPSPTPNNIAYFSPKGDIITVGSNVINKFLNGAYQRNATDYLETVFEFSGCETRAKVLRVPPRSTLLPNKPTGVTSLAELLFATANSDQLNGGNSYSMLGFRSVCAQHYGFCTGANQQFADFGDCVNTLRNGYQRISPCGKRALLSGNTIACRAKHQFMVQIDPDKHCPHIGPKSSVCSDSLCENPGLDSDVSNEVVNQNPALTKALYDINEYYRSLIDSGWWEFAQYCDLAKLSVKITIPGTGKILSLTEVQINGARGVDVTASSVQYGRDPKLIINGKIDGNFFNGDVTHTSQENNPYVSIKLANGGNLEDITVYGRTDCCQDRMAGAVATLFKGDGTVLRTSPLRLVDGATQRYTAFGKTFLKLKTPGTNHLHLSEVLVNGVAVTASSTGFSTNPNWLINGKIDGNFFNNDVFHSNFETNPWVKIELVPGEDPSNVIIYGRTDCCQDRMAGITATFEYVDGTVIKSSNLVLLDAATQKYVAFPKTYLRLTIPGQGKFLHLTEVQVKGVSVIASSAAYGTNPNWLINGKIDGNMSKGDVFHSAGETNPWVRIELAPGYNPVGINIYGRTDCCTDRMAGMVATVEYVDGNVIKSSTLRLTDATSQRYVAF